MNYLELAQQVLARRIIASEPPHAMPRGVPPDESNEFTKKPGHSGTRATAALGAVLWRMFTQAVALADAEPVDPT